MALFALPAFTAAPAPCGLTAAVGGKWKTDSTAMARRGFEPVRVFCPNSTQEPILKEALKRRKKTKMPPSLLCDKGSLGDGPELKGNCKQNQRTITFQARE